MAPPTVFSYLRGQHRRNQSSPTSPQFNQWQNISPSPRLESGNPSSPHRNLEDENLTSPSPVSPLPPTLPPIPRIASHRNSSLDESSQRQMASNQPNGKENLSYNQDYHRHAVRQYAPSYIDDSGLTSFRRGYAQGQPQITRYDAPFIGRVKTEDLYKNAYQKSPNQAQLNNEFGGTDWKHSDHPAYRKTGLRKPSETSGMGLESAPRPMTASTSRYHGDLHPQPNKSASSSPPPSSSASSFQKSSGTLTSESSNNSVTQPHKPSKTKTLLHPISLFMRRRTSHSTDTLTEDTFNNHRNLSVPAMSVPDDYDPRIKGKGVHDFSAPRPRRDFSNERKPPISHPVAEEASEDQPVRRNSLPTLKHDSTVESTTRMPEKQHAPVFVENFNDGSDNTASSSAVHRESLANSSFLVRWSKTMDQEATGPVYFGRSAKLDDQTAPVAPADRSSRNTDAPSWRTSSDQSTLRSSISNETGSTSRTQSFTQADSRLSALLDPAAQTSLAPQRIPSGASRFSFQMNNDRSAAQEKALEEKHKQKAASKALLEAAASNRLDEESDEEDYGDYDDIEDDLEEPIPGVNVDADYDEEDITVIPYNETDRFSSNDDSYIAETLQRDQKRFLGPTKGTHALMNGLGLSNLNDVHPLLRDQYLENNRDEILGSQNAEDDMYFDDGMIEPPDEQDRHDFDEEVFDIPTSSHYDLPGRTQNSVHKKRIHNPYGLKIVTQEPQAGNKEPPKEIGNDDEDYLNMARFGGPEVSHQASMRQPGLVLSQERLAAYQTALAKAANQAAADGRFERKDSIATIESQHLDLNGLENYGYSVDYNDSSGFEAYGEEDDGDYDPLVAAANAEALANDDEGFYRREFGFLNGDAGGDGLGRSMSGHNVCKEPNLTPITERSEFSTRNSFISLSTWNNHPPGTVPAPGLAQIAAGLRDQDDMTLSQFIDLKRKTFGAGGSSVSLTGSANSSPTSSTAPFSQRNDANRAPTYNRAPSAFDATPRALSKTEGPWIRPVSPSEPDSPAITSTSVAQSQSQRSSSSPTSPYTAAPHSPLTPSSPAQPPTPSLPNKYPQRRSWQHHRHSTSSGGQSTTSMSDRDSVAYVQEQDSADPGVTRWILERRRTEDTGEVRVVGRTVVEGGRI